MINTICLCRMGCEKMGISNENVSKEFAIFNESFNTSTIITLILDIFRFNLNHS